MTPKSPDAPLDLAMRRSIEAWLARCTFVAAVEIEEAHALVSKPEREVWRCRFRAEGGASVVALTIFKPGDLETVNTSLPPAAASRLCALAMQELPDLGVPTPRLLGQAAFEDEAAFACEWVEPIAWEPPARLEAARILARIHTLDEVNLSSELQGLVRISDPRMHRTTGGLAPPIPRTTLVHGDYFSKNLLPTPDGLRVIDWETFGRGDPMWDLGFLVGADRDIPEDEVESTLSEYARRAPVDRTVMNWHRERWSSFWMARRGDDRGSKGNPTSD